MTELAELYQTAERTVLSKYATTDQFWKIKAILEDRKNGRDSRTLQTFAEEVDNTVTELLAEKAKIVLPKNSSVSSSAREVSLGPVAPASPYNQN